jgi:hypothetical protein
MLPKVQGFRLVTQ